jgi:hypothetical protein
VGERPGERERERESWPLSPSFNGTSELLSLLLSAGCAGGYSLCAPSRLLLDFVTTKRCEVITSGALDVLSLFECLYESRGSAHLRRVVEVEKKGPEKTPKQKQKKKTSHRRSSPVTCSLSTHFIHDSVIIAWPFSLSFSLVSFPFITINRKSRGSFSSSRFD